MARKRSEHQGPYPMHIHARCVNREWFPLKMDETWRIFEDYLHFITHAFDIRIQSFVLMNNHFHALVTAPRGNLPTAMNYFMREVSRAIGRESGRINQVFGGPYNWSTIVSNTHLMNVYKYIYRNPVDAGLYRFVEEYPFSTLPGLLGLQKTPLIIPVFDDILFDDVEAGLSWLNTPYPDLEYRKALTLALRKQRMSFALDRDRHPHALDLKVL